MKILVHIMGANNSRKNDHICYRVLFSEIHLLVLLSESLHVFLSLPECKIQHDLRKSYPHRIFHILSFYTGEIASRLGKFSPHPSWK